MRGKVALEWALVQVGIETKNSENIDSIQFSIL